MEELLNEDVYTVRCLRSCPHKYSVYKVLLLYIVVIRGAEVNRIVLIMNKQYYD